MGLAYRDLDASTRKYMLEEIEFDVDAGTLYLSPWLTPAGRDAWRDLLTNAAAAGSDDSLAQDIRSNGFLVEKAQRRKPTGGFTEYTVPANGPSVVANGEFNRFYVRALCRRSIAEGRGDLVVYRAKSVENPRSSSEQKIGTFQNPAAILADLRASPGVEPALGLPPGPGSGLSLHLQ